MIKSLIAFDLDDTLYPESDYVLSGFKAVSQLMKNQFGMSNTYQEFVKTFGMGERKKNFNIALRKLGIEYNEELINEMVNCYRKHFPDIRPYNDVVPILKYLRQNNTLVLITDGYLDAQKNKIQALNIEQFFQKILYTDEYGKDYWKPNMRSFQMVMACFSVNNDECVYVGDNINKDFFAPNKLGWLTIQIKRKNGLHSDFIKNEEFTPKAKISSLLKLKEILK